MSNCVLKCEHIGKNFGGVKAVEDFSMEIRAGEIVGIIGPNGAGKTTIFNLISGINPSDTGCITLNGEEITHTPQEVIALKGIGRTFQSTRLFGGLTIIDNVKASIDSTAAYSLFDAFFRTRKFRKEEKRIEQEAMQCLTMLHLDQYAHERPGNLPYGIQRRVEIARALALRPALLLLDEPCAGLNPEEEKDLIKFIKLIQEQYHPSIMLIEHSMDFVMGICDRIYVQNFGHTIAHGTPKEIQSNTDVQKAYLG